MKFQPIARSLIALFSGILSVFAFAPFSIYPMAFIGPLVCFWLWQTDKPRQAFLHGYLYNIGLFGVGTYWIYYVPKVMGKIDSPFAEIISLILIAGIGLYMGLAGWGFAKLRRDHYSPLVLSGLLFPALWVLAEWLRSLSVIAFPWLLLGYSQIDSPLSGWAPVFGVYGISLLIAVSMGLIVIAWSGNSKTRFIVLAVQVLIWGGGAGLQQISWSQPIGDPLNIALVQRYHFAIDDDQDIKWPKYVALTKQLWKNNDIVLWSESSSKLYGVTIDSETSDNFIAQNKHLSKQDWQSLTVDVDGKQALLAFANYHEKLLTGALEKEAKLLAKTVVLGALLHDPFHRKKYNTLIALGSEQRSIYRKRHLAPFGEVTPGRNIFPTLWNKLGISQSRFNPGTSLQPLLPIANYNAAVSICYEAVFGNELLNAMPRAAFILVASRDSDYDQTWGMPQHLQIVQMRALENQRWLARATTSGSTAVISPTGKIIAQSASHEFNVLTSTIIPMNGITLYSYWGNYPVLLFSFLIIILAVFNIKYGYKILN